MYGDKCQDFAFAFLSILFEGVPFILLGTLISGFIDIYMPPGMMEKFLPRRKWLAVIMAGTLGAIFPVCECAVVPVIRRLVRKGLPVSCALTYMLAAPIFNPITAFSTWKAFSGPGMMVGGELMDASVVMTVARCALGLIAAVLVGWIALRLMNAAMLKDSLLRSLDDAQKEKPRDAQIMDSYAVLGNDTRLIAAMRSALRDFMEVGVYFIIGVAITALFNTGIAPGAAWLDSLANRQVLAPVALMALAFILSLCSSSDAFIAATLDKFTYGAKLAFLTFGPMFDLKLLFLYQTVLRRGFILCMAAGLFVFIGGAAIAFQWYLSSQATP